MAAAGLRVVLHLVVAFVLTFALGFERELRGAVLAAVTGTVLILLVLEWRHIPGLKVLDARRWSSGLANDEVPDAGRVSGSSRA